MEGYIIKETDTETPIPMNVPERSGRIYKITCSVTKRCYVGKTTRSVRTRFLEHMNKKSTCRLLRDSIIEHGRSSFTVETLWEGFIGDLGKMEKQMIKEHQTIHPTGYNLTEGGGRGEKACLNSLKNMINKQREISLRKKGKLGVITENRSNVDGRITSWSLVVFRNGIQYTAGNCKTKEEISKIQDEFTKDPDGFHIPPRKRNSGGDAKCIYYSNKRNKWVVVVNKTFLGRFDTREQAQEVHDSYILNPDVHERILKERVSNKKNREDIGVAYSKFKKKWCATRWENKKLLSLGGYETKEEAITARKRFIEDPESFVRPNQRKKIKL